jgi:hypothetical protein
MIRRSREPMTIAQLKRSMDTRFTRVDRRFKRVDQRFKRVDVELRRLRQELHRQSDDTRRQFQRQSKETRQHFEDARRHFDVVADSLRDDMRMFAEAIGTHSERFGDHEVRLRRLEQPRLS